jgi:hypothetical protein
MRQNPFRANPIAQDVGTTLGYILNQPPYAPIHIILGSSHRQTRSSPVPS